MNNKAEIIIKLDARGQKEVKSAIKGVRKETDNLDESAGRLDKSMIGLGIGVGAVALGILKLGTNIYGTTAMFQKLSAMLKTATGSSEGAAQAMDLIRSIASDTPFQITELTSAYIKLKNLGLNPTKQALKDYGNIAAGMGKQLDQMIEAAADASVMEFERLKEFGIKASKKGDQITFTFRGVKTTVKAEAAEINKYLQDLGRVEFAGAMTEQMDTLDGAASNLSDSWDQLLNSIGNMGPADAATDSMRSLTEMLVELNGLINPDKQQQIKQLEMNLGQAINQMDQARKHADWAWNPWGDPEEWQSRVNKLTGQLNEMKGLDPFSQDVAGLKRAAGSNDVGAHQTASAGYIPPDQGNLDIMAAEGKAVPEDSWLMRSKGLDAEAIERAKTAKLEFSEWLRDQEMTEAEQIWESEQLKFEQKQAAVYREIEMVQRSADEREKIEKELQKKKIQIQKNAVNAGLGVLQMLQSGSLQQSKKGFEIAKAAAIAETTINTYKAATGAYSAMSGIPYIGPVLGAVAAAAAIAAGMANVSAISSQQFGGGGGGGGGGAVSYGNPGTPTNPISTLPPPAAQEETEPRQEIHIHFPPGATVINSTPEEFARRMLPEIRQAASDGA